MKKIVYLVIFVSLLISLAMPASVLLWKFCDHSELDARFVASCLSCISSNFDFNSDRTWISRSHSVKATIYYVISVVGGSLILTICINATIAFKVHVKGAKVGQGMPRRTLVALGSVAWLFIVSYLPLVIYSIWSYVDPPAPQSLHTLLNCTIGLNVFCNPMIYVISNKKFRGNVTSRFSVAVGPNVWVRGPVGQGTLAVRPSLARGPLPRS